MTVNKSSLTGSAAAVIAGLMMMATVVLVIVLVWGGGAPVAALQGLPDAGPVVGWALATIPLLVNMVSIPAIGFALLAGGLIPGASEPMRLDARRSVIFLGVVWAVLELAAALLTAFELRVESPTLAMQGVGVLLGSNEVRTLLVEVVLVTLLCCVALAGSARVAVFLPLLAILAPLPAGLLSGHVATADSPLVSGAALAIHITAASIWVGGLVVMAWLALRYRDTWANVVSGYSRIALACVVALAVSGLVSALGQVGPGQILTTQYGVVITMKVVVLVGLVVMGMLQRRHIVGKDHARGRDFLALAGTELVMMALAIALATGLSATPTPV